MKYLKLNLALLFLLCSCAKESTYVPNVAVNFRASLSDPKLNSLNSPGSSVIIQGYGVAGLVIYRGLDFYVAFDRCSTVNPEKKCAVVIDPSGITATDPCSGAMFSLYNGSAVKAPASRPLRRYQVYTDYGNISIVN